ncbi:translation elongation factor [Pueribacillus theae]|uniref:Translation elongation factor n=1 Tax=Pueribacillus theae TaxID=2171751 RepID=A0A2U1K1I5_9BACI|nr:translation elongation factor [Pueribacillus theae]PWA11054.1 translation elongation factor [Pueribacillus theae]
MSKTDKAWEVLFQRHDILNNVQKNGFFEIQAKEIRKEREPRLMAKFDHYKNLPTLFKENGLSILPISRSSYVIGEFDVYSKVNYDKNLKPVQVPFPSHITTIDPTNLYSESSALHCAHVTGMMADVLGEEPEQTISGRMSSKEFGFTIRTRSGLERLIEIKNSQVEIDGGYESKTKFMIVEAKNEKVDDFLVRQIYYPYRLWREKTYKEVKPVFFTYSNDIFSFFVYEFTDANRYNSLRLIEQKDYIIAHENITFDDVAALFHSIRTQAEPQIPFPQADSFPRIVDLLGLLVENDLSKEDITLNYDFDARQTNYYTTAAIYLDLVERYINKNKQVMFRLTSIGREIMLNRTKEKYLKLAGSIFAHEPFKRVFQEYLNTSKMPERKRVIQIMKECDLYNINSESTYFRRASTVISWTEWIMNLPKIY